ncbi:MAG: hypothetical protein WC560_10000 [Syntrophales bacterium]
MRKNGRNDFSPYGSGEEYKDRCSFRDEISHRLNDKEPLQLIFEQISESLNGRDFSIEETPNRLEELIELENHDEKTKFLEFSPEQVYRLLYFPFEQTADMVTFNHYLPSDVFQSVPIVQDILIFLNELSRVEPLKATAGGNLPLKFCRLLLEKLPPFEESDDFPIRSEENSIRLNSIRQVLKMCGWIKKEHKYFVLTHRGNKILTEGFKEKDFFQLLKIYTTKFNWAFHDRYLPFWIIQESFLFSLSLLTQKALEYIEDTQLAGYFIEAFPLLLEEVEMKPCRKPEEVAAKCYSLRFLERFCKLFGFAEIKKEEKSLSRYRLFVKSSDFLKNYIQWNTPAKFPFFLISDIVH